MKLNSEKIFGGWSDFNSKRFSRTCFVLGQVAEEPPGAKSTSTKSKIDEIKNDKTCQNRRGALAICHLFIKQSND